MAFPWWLIGKDSTCNAGDAKDADSTLGWEDSPEEGNGNPSSILFWELPWTGVPGGLQSRGSQRVGQDPTEATWHTKNAKQRPVVLAKVLDVDMFGVTSRSRKADGFRLLFFSVS